VVRHKILHERPENNNDFYMNMTEESYTTVESLNHVYIYKLIITPLLQRANLLPIYETVIR